MNEEEKQKRKRLLWREFANHPCMTEFVAMCEKKVEMMERSHHGKSYDEARDLFKEAEGARKVLAFLKGKVSNTTQ